MVDGVGWRVEARLKMSSGVSRFNGSIIVGMKVTGQYPKLQLVKRRMGRSGRFESGHVCLPAKHSITGPTRAFPLVIAKIYYMYCITCILLYPEPDIVCQVHILI